MPIYLFWGEDDFALSVAVKKLQESVVDPNWFQFNCDRISDDRPLAIIDALNLAMTPVFGMGERLVWLTQTTICQNCPPDLLSQLESTLPVIPPTSHLLFTSTKKPDRRLKSTKLIEKYATVTEFSPIAPWKIQEITNKVTQFSQEIGVKLTPDAIELIAKSVGNNSRQLWNELEKLSIYGQTKTLDLEVISTLVNCNTQSSIDLAQAIRTGNKLRAIELTSQLLDRDEPALRIVATLVNKFRTWAIVKLMEVKGEKNQQLIAQTAEIGNPKRIYYLRQEIKSISSEKLVNTFPILLELELGIKQGCEPLSTLKTKVIELCEIFD